VEGGTFMMGASDEYIDLQTDDEKPLHKVNLDSYYIGETQVTQELWQTVMGNNPSCWQEDRFPVEQVSWDDCQEFIKKLNNLTGKTFALPTEAQWEYAARGGNKSKGYLHSGGNDIDEVGWYEYNSGSDDIDDDGYYAFNSNALIHEVAIKKANELGLYDMSGNVEEWCNDWYDNEYYAYSPLENPKGPSSGFERVLRGGSWAHYEQACRVFDRRCEHPSIRYKDSNYRHYGLRLALYQTPPDLEFYVNGVLFKMKYVCLFIINQHKNIISYETYYHTNQIEIILNKIIFNIKFNQR
jgi:formylglycine-generating enzyme required for sulfatase activity